jgi:hypothetical protein
MAIHQDLPAQAAPVAHDEEVTSYTNAPTRTVSADGVQFAYRELGPQTGVPVVFLTHLAAVLDNWDPRRRSPAAQVASGPGPARPPEHAPIRADERQEVGG